MKQKKEIIKIIVDVEIRYDNELGKRDAINSALHGGHSAVGYGDGGSYSFTVKSRKLYQQEAEK